MENTEVESEKEVKEVKFETEITFLAALEQLIDYCTMDDEFQNLEEFVANNESNDGHITVAAAACANIMNWIKENAGDSPKIKVTQTFIESEVFGLDYKDFDVVRIEE